jgi:hypothetical protein
MLQLTIRKETTTLGTAGEMRSIRVDAGSLSHLISVVEPDQRAPGDPPDSWRTYILDRSCSDPGASLLHALELGVLVTARWLAVELLKDPAPPVTATQPMIYLSGDPEHEPSLRVYLSPNINFGGYDALTYGLCCVRLTGPRHLDTARFYASREQALAVLIEHAAPWIASALEKEIAT